MKEIKIKTQEKDQEIKLMDLKIKELKMLKSAKKIKQTPLLSTKQPVEDEYMVSPQVQPYENPASMLLSPENDIQRTTKRKNKILFVKNIQKSNNTEARKSYIANINQQAID